MQNLNRHQVLVSVLCQGFVTFVPCCHLINKGVKQAGAQGYSLEAQVEDLQPNPRQNQQHQHGGEGEGEPGGKVDDAAVSWIEAGKCRWLLASKISHSLLSFIKEAEKGRFCGAHEGRGAHFARKGTKVTFSFPALPGSQL